MPSLRQDLTLTTALALVVSNMIGTGIFTTTGFLAGDLGRPPLVIGIWVAGAAVALAGAFSYAELGINLPRSGGEYVYLREAWGPASGFLSGWSSYLAGFSAPIAAAALAFSAYLGHIFPAVGSSQATFLKIFHVGTAQWVSVAVIVFFAAINVAGLALAARLQDWVTGMKVAALGLFLLLAFAVGHGSWANLSIAAPRSSPHSLGAQFAVSLIFVMFAYSGWNAAAYVTEEMRDPKRNLPRALALGTALVAAIYVALNVAFVYALPLEAMKGVIAVGAAASDHLFGVAAGNVFAAIMAVGLLSCVSAMSLVGPRVYYAMAQDGCFPRAAAAVHPVRRTPGRAIWFQAVASIAMVLTGTFEALIYYIGFTLIFFSALAVAGLLKLRRRPQWQRLSVVSFAYPAIPALFLIASAWMLAWTVVVQPKEAGLGILTVAAGWVVYRMKVPSSQFPVPSAELQDPVRRGLGTGN